MPQYDYTALDRKGLLVFGREDAASRDDVDRLAAYLESREGRER